MSQLFNIVFPRFWFDVQKEHEFEFNDPDNLPFSVMQDQQAIYVESVEELPLNDRRSIRKSKRFSQSKTSKTSSENKRRVPEELMPGLRIIAIDGKDITDRAFTVSKFKRLITLLRERKSSVTITFREEIESEDENIYQPLGLGYGKPQNDDEFGNRKTLGSESLRDRLASIRSMQSMHDITPFNKSINLQKIEDHNITASSFRHSFDPFHARLNNPNSCWMPLTKNLSSFVWLKIDLNSTKQIARISIQGNKDHSNYISAIWIDYSLDGCQWKSYFKRESVLNYKETNIAEIKFWPVMQTRFIRLRPQRWHKDIALRLELFGLHTLRKDANIHNARVVNFLQVDADYKKRLLEKTKNLPRDTTVIQVDCQKVIASALDRAGITEVSWLKCYKSAENVSMCSFSTRSVGESERALDCLTDIGIGNEMGTINVMPVHFRNDSSVSTNVFDIEKYRKLESTSSFAKSIKNRKLVQEMIDRVMDSAIISFDYLMNLFAASCIAVSGLATGNSVIIVASMLVSPIMGPVMAVTFGFTIKEPIMIWIGAKNEAISLVVCVLIGFVFGLLYALISEDSQNWPTAQMSDRGTPVSLADGAFVAIVSGIGVALSVVGDYASAVIGVAISASLLPPAVNTGMLFAYALYLGDDNDHDDKDGDSLSRMAMYSLLLTIENVILIIGVAMIMFKIKDIVQIKDKNTSVWKTVTNFGQKQRAPQVDMKARVIMGIRRRQGQDFGQSQVSGQSQIEYAEDDPLSSVVAEALRRQSQTQSTIYSIAMKERAGSENSSDSVSEHEMRPFVDQIFNQ